MENFYKLFLAKIKFSYDSFDRIEISIKLKSKGDILIVFNCFARIPFV